MIQRLYHVASVLFYIELNLNFNHFIQRLYYSFQMIRLTDVIKKGLLLRFGIKISQAGLKQENGVNEE